MHTHRIVRIDDPSPVLKSRARKHHLVHGVKVFPPMTLMSCSGNTSELFAVPFASIGGAVLPAFPFEVVTDAIRDWGRMLDTLNAKRRHDSAAPADQATTKDAAARSASREWRPLVAVASCLNARDLVRLATTSRAALKLMCHHEFCVAVARWSCVVPPAPYQDPTGGRKLWRRTRGVLEQAHLVRALTFSRFSAISSV